MSILTKKILLSSFGNRESRNLKRNQCDLCNQTVNFHQLTEIRLPTRQSPFLIVCPGHETHLKWIKIRQGLEEGYLPITFIPPHSQFKYLYGVVRTDGSKGDYQIAVMLWPELDPENQDILIPVMVDHGGIKVVRASSLPIDKNRGVLVEILEKLRNTYQDYQRICHSLLKDELQYRNAYFNYHQMVETLIKLIQQ